MSLFNLVKFDGGGRYRTKCDTTWPPSQGGDTGSNPVGAAQNSRSEGKFLGQAEFDKDENPTTGFETGASGCGVRIGPVVGAPCHSPAHAAVAWAAVREAMGITGRGTRSWSDAPGTIQGEDRPIGYPEYALDDQTDGDGPHSGNDDVEDGQELANPAPLIRCEDAEAVWRCGDRTRSAARPSPAQPRRPYEFSEAYEYVSVNFPIAAP